MSEKSFVLLADPCAICSSPRFLFWFFIFFFQQHTEQPSRKKPHQTTNNATLILIRPEVKIPVTGTQCVFSVFSVKKCCFAKWQLISNQAKKLVFICHNEQIILYFFEFGFPVFYDLIFMPIASCIVLLQCQTKGKIIRTGNSTESI